MVDSINGSLAIATLYINAVFVDILGGEEFLIEVVDDLEGVRLFGEQFDGLIRCEFIT